MSIYNQPIRNKKLFTTVIVAAVLVMFILRGILLRQGKVGTPSALSPDQIQEELQKTEISVRTGSAQGHGTVLQMNRQKRGDVFYIVTAEHLRGDEEKALQVTDSDGNAFTGDVRGENEKRISCWHDVTARRRRASAFRKTFIIRQSRAIRFII